MVIVWLIPVTTEEAAFARVNGWDKFEAKLIEQNPDLVDVYREPVI